MAMFNSKLLNYQRVYVSSVLMNVGLSENVGYIPNEIAI